MYRLDYFTPYENKPPNHEDQLTRAFLVILRYIPLAQVLFTEIVRTYQTSKKAEYVLPDFYNTNNKLTLIDTQVTQVPTEGASYLLSVIMTDKRWTPKKDVEASKRDARYDGILQYGSFVLTIENKLYSENIWEEQLDPAIEDNETLIVEKKPVVLLWPDIISNLTSIFERGLLNYAEKLLLEDFFDFIDNNFLYLNPYNNLSICKRQELLVNRRIKLILEDISPGQINYHRGSGQHIDLGNKPLRMIWLNSSVKEGKVEKIRLHLYPGDTMVQARRFYSGLDIDKFMLLEKKGWVITDNLHFSFMATHLHWVKKCPIGLRPYLEYWKNGKRNIEQIWRNSQEFDLFFNELLNDNLVTQEDIKPLQDNFTNTSRPTLNLCPGVMLECSWEIDDAEALDNKRDFTGKVIEKIAEAFSTWGQAL